MRYGRKKKIYRRKKFTSYRKKNMRRTRAYSVRNIVRNMAEKKRYIETTSQTETSINSGGYMNYVLTCTPVQGTGLTQRVGTKIQITSTNTKLLMQQRVADPPKDHYWRFIWYTYKDAQPNSSTPSTILLNAVDAPTTDIGYMENICAPCNTNVIVVKKDITKIVGTGSDIADAVKIFSKISLKGDCSFDQTDNNIVEPNKNLFLYVMTTNIGTNNKYALSVTTQYRYIDI